jgi:hypothetical protein
MKRRGGWLVRMGKGPANKVWGVSIFFIAGHGFGMVGMREGGPRRRASGLNIFLELRVPQRQRGRRGSNYDRGECYPAVGKENVWPWI